MRTLAGLLLLVFCLRGMNMQVSSTDGIDTSMTEDPNGSLTTESTEHSRHHCQLNDASTCTKYICHWWVNTATD
ncbi:unnamed protein product [Fasciola hepatica]|uniref:Uncharacterized protein n=1 Tax=Fasciola hepatica TaxID=6192 RepID=A0ABC9HHD9_FASHE|nr:unnamed protein product [Fasciola hepatica]